MAALYHVRSNSLPSRPHPFTAQAEEKLSRLRSSESASTSSSICQQLNGLQDLHDRLEKLVQLPFVQEEKNKKMVDELLDRSLRLVDVCNVAKDALLQMKEGIQEIQSALRRKRGDYMIEVKKYLASRKSLKKAFHKVLKSLKAPDNKYKDNETLAILSEAEAITVTMFDSLLCFISGTNIHSKPSSRWSLVSNLVKNNRIACEDEEANENEFARVDSALYSLLHKKSGKTTNTEDLQSLEKCIQDLEEGLERIFRSLIKARVSFLNILGN